MTGFYSSLYHFIKIKQNKTTNVYFHKPSMYACNKLSLPWRLNKVSRNDTSGHSVGSFVQSQILYGQTDPIRLSFLTYLALSSGRNYFIHHSGSTRIGTPSRDRVLNPYRITPIHWLMARRRLWRNDVVRSYWRTRHPLLRFLCLHEAATSPFVVAISYPSNNIAIIHLHFGDCLCGTLFSSRWSAMEFRRCMPPCTRFIARTVSVFCVWVFRTHVRRFMGPLTAKFATISVS